MDDPWGSPWADEAAQPLPPVKTDNPITPDKPSVVEPQNWSPWDDDGDIGELRTRLEDNGVAQEVPDSEDGLEGLWDFEEAPTSGTNGIADELNSPSSTSTNQELSISSLSGHIDQIETRQESPQASVDEEVKRLAEEGQESSKVKQLVQLFDGLAVQTPEAPVRYGSSEVSSDTGISSATRHQSPAREHTEHEFGDLEFEEDDSSAKLSKALRDIGDSADKGFQPLAQGKVPVVNDETPSAESLTATADSNANVIHPVAFKVKFALSDQIFGKTSEVFEATEPDARRDLEEELSTTIQDSFSSVEQRKIWYRISRYGTMRKHNSGDEDYVRMNWAHSKIRDETLKIVARWVEEDRIGGVVLGGTAKLESIFGWGKPKNEKAQTWPVKNQGLVSAPPTALHRPFGTKMLDTTTGWNSVSSSLASKKSPESASHTTAHFNWSSAQSESTGIAAEIAVPSYNSSGSFPPPPKAAGSPLQTVQHAVTTLKSKSNGRKSHQIERPSPMNRTVDKNAGYGDKKDDEDEWGDMVSSAVTESPPIPFRTTHESSVAVQDSARAAITASSSEVPVPSKSEATTFLKDDSMTSFTADGWATAAFSFLDPQAASLTNPPLGLQVQEKFSPLGNESVNLQEADSSKEEVEQEATAKSIIQQLPDLSYMLRR